MRTYLVAAVCCAVLLSGGTATSAQSVRGQAALPQATLGSGFTYQGRLQSGAAPAEGPHDLRIILYDAEAGGSQVGVTLALEDVPVEAGYFTTLLDFGPVFDGRALWLEVAVRPGTSTGSYTTLSPRQPLTAAPYASYAAGNWSLAGNAATAPDTHFLGTTDAQPLVIRTNDSEAVRVDSEGNVGIGTQLPGARMEAGGENIAVMGTSPTRAVVGRMAAVDCPGRYAVGGCGSQGGMGVYGSSDTSFAVFGFSGQGIGIQGESLTDHGVVGRSQQSDGVRGESVEGTGVGALSRDGPAVYGISTNNSGVVGQSDKFYGVYGVSTSNYGVVGMSQTLIGVHGVGYSGHGVYGRSTGATGVRGESSTGYGVAGESNSGMGVYARSQASYGLYATAVTAGVVGNGQNRGVVGTLGGTSCAGEYAVGGCSGASTGAGVYGRSAAGVGVLASTDTGDLFRGVTGTGQTRRARIDSSGRGFFNNGTQVGGADYAESMRTSDEPGTLEPGDVLALDPAVANAVQKSRQPTSYLVAGVYSTRPSILAVGEHNIDDPRPGEVPVALLGIVPTKVSAENGPIRIGDLLVTAVLPGHAMRAIPVDVGGVAIYPTGAVLGKALEPLAAGTGVIQVLVTLR